MERIPSILRPHSPQRTFGQMIQTQFESEARLQTSEGGDPLPPEAEGKTTAKQSIWHKVERKTLNRSGTAVSRDDGDWEESQKRNYSHPGTQRKRFRKKKPGGDDEPRGGEPNRGSQLGKGLRLGQDSETTTVFREKEQKTVNNTERRMRKNPGKDGD